jgi:putative hemolysin
MFEIALLLLLIVVNGVFAMSEIAVVSSRRARLQQLVEGGHPGAARALELADDPGRFLSTIQVGITTIGIMSGAIGEASIAEGIRARLEQVPALAGQAEPIALVAMVILVTFLSLIVGELVPKRLAMLRPEAIAAAVARPMHALSRVARPVVHVLGRSTDLVLGLLRAPRGAEPSVTDEEIRVMMAQGAREGVFVKTEQTLVENALLLDRRRVGSVMTPRMDIVFLDLRDPPAETQQRLLEHPYSVFPVCDGGLDNVVGMVRSKAMLSWLLVGRPLELRALAEPPRFIPESLSLMQLLEHFKRARLHTTLAVDEYGEVAGLVSLDDVLESIVGDLPPAEGEQPEAAQRADGSWLIDGLMDLHELRRRLGIGRLPGEDSVGLHTLSGYVMLNLGRVPRVTDTFEAGGLRFEVVDMDGHRVDKVLVRRLAPDDRAHAPGGPAP